MYHRRYWIHGGSRSRGIDCAAEIYDTMQSVNGLFELLQLCIYFDATDPRDLIYGLRGLIPSTSAGSRGQSLAIKPDYAQASLVDVYGLATRVAIAEGSLTVLKRAAYIRPPAVPKTYSNPTLQLGKFPSWVPRFDWTWDPNQGSPSAISAMTILGAHNSVEPEMRPPLKSHSDELWMAGVVDGEVSVCADTIFSPCLLANEDDLASSLRAAWKLAQGCAVPSYVDTGQDDACLDSFIETLVAGKNADAELIEGSTAFKASFKAFMALHGGLSGAHNMPQATCQAQSEQQQSFLQALKENAMNRKFFVTSKGRLGLGPQDTKPGDTVSVLLGGDAPFILKSKSGRMDMYRLVVEAYIDGIMKGQLIASIHQDGELARRRRWFGLC